MMNHEETQPLLQTRVWLRGFSHQNLNSQKWPKGRCLKGRITLSNCQRCILTTQIYIAKMLKSGPNIIVCWTWSVMFLTILMDDFDYLNSCAIWINLNPSPNVSFRPRNLGQKKHPQISNKNHGASFPWLAAVLIFFFARVDFLFTNLTSRIWRDPQIRCRPQRRAVVSQTVMEDTETWRFFTRSLSLWYVCWKWPWFVFFWSALNAFEWLVTLKFYESGGSI